MSIDFIAEVWDALRPHVDSNERKDAADTLINLLIDNDYEAADIKEAFRGDKDILGALKFYAEQHEEDDYEDDEDEDQDEWD